jgi:hypothetical protein
VSAGRRILAVFLLALLAPAVAGCGSDPDEGTNGVGRLPPRTIESRARAAAESADAVHLSGTVVGKGGTYRLDMRLRDDGGLGQVTTEDGTFELLRVDDDLYLKAGADFYGSDVAGKLDDKYVKVPTDDPAYQQFSGLTDKVVLRPRHRRPPLRRRRPGDRHHRRRRPWRHPRHLSGGQALPAAV